MQIALNVNVQVKDGTLVLTDRAGQTVTFSKEHTVQKKVSMIGCVPPFTHPVTQRVEGLSLEKPQHPEKGT